MKKNINSHTAVLTANGFVQISQHENHSACGHETIYIFKHPSFGIIRVDLVHESIFNNPAKQWFHRGGGNGTTAKKLADYIARLNS